MSFKDFDIEKPVRLRSRPGVPEQSHLFDETSVLAIQSAIAASRPLLVRGEPGVGKTQLAFAAAVVLERPLVSFVVDARTESSDLKYDFDSVRRLAEAQLCGASGTNADDARELLKLKKFITPGPLWWGFNWDSAAEHCKENELVPQSPEPVDEVRALANGCVVLIDEIDKAETDVPNGLLEALGNGEFTPPGCDRVEAKKPAPLVVITTNEERALPDAFVRRCLVLSLAINDLDEDKLRKFFVERGRAHFQNPTNDSDFIGPTLSDDLLTTAANMLISDRHAMSPPLPGVAEYLDLLRAVGRLEEDGVGTAEELIKSVDQFTLKKHSGPQL